MDTNTNGDRQHRLDGLRCDCGGSVLMLVNRTEAKVRCAECGRVFGVVRVIAEEKQARLWLREVGGLPPFLRRMA